MLDGIGAGGLLAPDVPVVAMCSGGQDSVCLVDVAVSLCGPDAVRVLHVNYGLRSAQSDGDEALVRALCLRLGVALEVVAASRPVGAVGNLQAWARDVRYAEAARLGGLVATGHTATDQVETVLYRLAASPGRRALLGMTGRDGRLIRPLLGVTRHQTKAYCQARDLAWREDTSNDDQRFARVRTRQRLVPALQELHPAAERNVARTAELLRDEAAVLDRVVTEALAGRSDIHVARLGTLEPAVARLVITRMAEDAAGRLVPGIGGRLADLVALGAGGGSAQLDLGRSVRAIVEYGVLRMQAIDPPADPEPVELSVPGRAWFGDWELRCEVGAAADGLGRLEPDGSVGLLAAEALTGSTLTVRAWRPGDRLQPLGMTGSRSLADLFCDRRVPRAERGLLPVVMCGDAIAWVPGVVTAERFRVGAASARAAVLSAVQVGESAGH